MQNSQSVGAWGHIYSLLANKCNIEMVDKKFDYDIRPADAVSSGRRIERGRSRRQRQLSPNLNVLLGLSAFVRAIIAAFDFFDHLFHLLSLSIPFGWSHLGLATE